jgi:hypothetical protein
MKFLPSTIQSALIALGFLLSPTATQASVMTFETATPGSMLTAPYEQNGIRLSVLTGHYDIWQCGQQSFIPPCTGVVAGIDEAMTGPATIRIELMNGALFNLMGLTILNAGPDDWIGASNGVNLRFDSWPTMPPLSAFQGIRYVELQSQSLLPGLLFDNIQLNEVPEPAPLALLLIGGLLLGASRLHRK